MTAPSSRLSLYGGRDPRDLPAYRVSEAALLTRVPAATLRSWVFGRSYPTETGSRRFEPVIERPDEASRLISFTNLVEAHVLSSIRTLHGVRLDKVRAAIHYTRDRLGVSHPLASGRFVTDGANLFVDHLGHLVNASREGQLAMRELLKRLLTRVDVDENQLAHRFYPLLRRDEDGPKSIVVDPAVAFGRPVLAGTGVPVAVLRERWRGGESLRELSEDYGLDVALVEDALRYEYPAAA